MLTLFVDNKQINTNRIKFSDGAVSFNLEDFPANADHVHIAVDSKYKVGELLDELCQLADAVGQTDYDGTASLYLPYLPYARADRKFSEKGNRGLINFMYMLTEIGIDKLITVDPHNEAALLQIADDVGIAVEFTTQQEAFRYTMSREHISPYDKWDYVVAPDNGAKSKALSCAAHFNLKLLECTKDRDVATGKLSNPVVPKRLDGAKCLIVDDLCDGGYTFIQLAQELRKQGAISVSLYVTHLIASKGLSVLTDYIDKVYTYQACCGYVSMQDVTNFNKGEILT